MFTTYIFDVFWVLEMSNKKTEFLEKRRLYIESMNSLNSEIAVIQAESRHYSNEATRIENRLNNVEEILLELKEEFKENTKLDSVDMTFLFFATSLQCIRWMFQPKVCLQFEKISSENRHDASKDGNLEMKKAKEELKKEKYKNDAFSRRFPNKKDIFLNPVPYDAMKGTENIEIMGVTGLGKNISGSNHHSATLGHDPILGYFFGTINILTKTITFNKVTLDTNIVRRVRGTEKAQYVSNSIGFLEALDRSFSSLKEDATRLPAAVIRQYMHMESDKYTKHGLPIPLIAPEKAQSLLEQGWNSNELERLINHIGDNLVTVGKQVSLSLLINAIIEVLYKLIDHKELDKDLVEVKFRKILSYSNLIASSSNVIYTTISKNINNLDIGGILVTICRVAKDKKMIQDIKAEYIFSGFERDLKLREFTI